MGIDWEAKVGAPNVRVFGDPALYVPRDNSAPYVVTGVFDESYQEVTVLDADAGTASGRPVIGINAAQGAGKQAWDADDRVVTGITVDAAGAVTIPGTARTWMVQVPEPDSKGHTMLMLMKTADYTP